MHRLVATSDEDGVPLNKKFMARLFGGDHQWNDCRIALIGDGHMQELDDGFYVPGVQSKRYALGERWSDAGTARVECRNAALLERLHSWEKRRPARERWLPIHFWLRDMLRMLTIDINAIDPTIRDSRHVQWVIEAIAAESPRASVCDYGRFHSLATNMRREVRQALRINGQKLVELDVACCQPLLLAHLATCASTDQFTINSQLSLGAKCKSISRHTSHTTTTNPNPPTTHTNPPTQTNATTNTILCASLSTYSDASTYSDSLIDEPDPVPGNLLRFTRICEQGDIYEHLADIWGWDASDSEQRKQVKTEVFRTLLFGRIPRGKHWSNYRQWIQFAEEYPSLAVYLRSMKLTTKDHGTVARLAQRLEAWLMLERICGRIKTEIPGAAFVTVHDSVLVEQLFAQGVLTIMREEFASISLNPTIRLK
jgi:hypothetical protein